MPRRVPTYQPPSLGSSKSREREYNQTPERRASNNFYNGSPWRTVKGIKLRQDPLCERCKAKGLVVVAVIVHHKLERKDRPDLALDLDNLESLCRACHGSIHGWSKGPGGTQPRQV